MSEAPEQFEHERASDLAAELLGGGLLGGEDSGVPVTDSGPPKRGRSGAHYMNEIMRMPRYRAGLPATTTGFEIFDKLLQGGFRAQSMYTLAGRTGGAKSTLALNIVRRVALAQVPVLMLKLEEGLIEGAIRIHAATAQVPYRILMDGKAKQVDHATRKKLVDAYHFLKDLPLRMADTRNICAIETLVQQHADQGTKLVVIDQLSHIEYPGTATGFERATETSSRLRHLALSTGLPIVLVCQVGREASKKRERLSMNDLRDSGAIENDSAGVLLVDHVRPPEGPWKAVNPSTVEVLIGKNRYGPVTTGDDKPIELELWPTWGRIEEPTRQPQPTEGGADE